MTRQLEQVREDQQSKLNSRTLHAVGGGLSDAVQRSGGILLGFSVRLSGGDCLITLRANLAGRNQIAFVGGEDLGAALRKVVYDGSRDKLNWRKSRYDDA